MPNYDSVLTNSQNIPKWSNPQNEHSFFYQHNPNYKHIIDLQINKEESPKRKLALQKLYYEFKNKKTFKKYQKIKNITKEP